MNRQSTVLVAAAFATLVLAGLVLSRLDFRTWFASGDDPRAPVADLPEPARESTTAAPEVRPPSKVDAPVRDAGALELAHVRDAGTPPPAPTLDARGAPEEEDRPGSLRESDVQVAIASAEPLVRECFEDARDRYPPPQRVRLRFRVTGDGTRGRLERTEILGSSASDPWLESCFLDALTDTRFDVPEGSGAITVTHVFSFPGEGADAGGR